jgi:hypothetical protein
MARARRLGAALAAVAALLAVVPALPASALRTLHVDALSMRADRSHVRVGQVFHLAIHARVRERVGALDELVVPNVGTMLLEGDERHVGTATDGTDVVETLTLEATQPGTYTFNGAYLDAVDARNGKPSRFSANAVRVVVEPRGGSPAEGYRPSARLIATAALAGGIAIAALAGVVALLRARRRAQRPVSAPTAEPNVAAPPPRTPREEVAEALRAYRSAPAMRALMRLRAALFAAAGVNAGATLRDALAATSDRALRAALGAAERTAFGPAHARDASSAELIDATEGWLQ